MAGTPIKPADDDQDPPEATLVFHEQSDGRKVARLPGGKVVLVDLGAMDRKREGEAWFVKLRHLETFAIAHPVERVTRATLESTLPHSLGDVLARAKPMMPRRDGNAAPPPAATASRQRSAAAPHEPARPPGAQVVDLEKVLRPFERAVELLRSRGKRNYIVSARGQLSRELAYVADEPIVYLEEHRAIFARVEQGTGASRQDS